MIFKKSIAIMVVDVYCSVCAQKSGAREQEKIHKEHKIYNSNKKQDRKVVPTAEVMKALYTGIA